jgi:hypothetical protein
LLRNFSNVHVQLHLVWLSGQNRGTERMKSSWLVEDGQLELVKWRFEGDVVAASKKIQIGNSVGGPNFHMARALLPPVIGPRSVSVGPALHLAPETVTLEKYLT